MSKTNAPTFDIASHDGSTKGLKLAGTLVTASASELNLAKNQTATAVAVNSISSRPSAATSTISAVAGATNVSTVTIQIKNADGTNVSSVTPFSVYASSASTGLTLASAASTGFSVASGGMSRANGAAITTQISAMSSATGGCVLSLTDTGKQTSYLVLVVGESVKISTQLSAGSYG